MISNFIGTMTCLSNLNHLSEDMQSSLSRFLDHPSRSKLRGIHLKINGNSKLKKLLGAEKELKADEIYKLQSNLEYNLIYQFLKQVFHPKKRKRNKKAETIIIDTSSIKIDLNMWRNRYKIGKSDKKYRYSYGPSIGYYVGFKLILAINQDYELLGFEIHKDSPNDSKILIPFIEKLFRARIIKCEDIIVCDKGFTSKANYQTIINRFNLVPLIHRECGGS